MADKKDDPQLRFITPRGTARYPRLTKPDTGTKQFPAKPNYNITVIFDGNDDNVFIVGKTTKTPLAEVRTQLEALRDAQLELVKAGIEADTKKNPKNKAKNAKALELLHVDEVFKEEVDEEGNATGRLHLRAKTAAERKDKDDPEKIIKVPPPTLFSASGKVLNKLGKLPNVGGGSIVKVGALAKPYYVASSGAVGIAYYLEATQLLDLVEFGQRDAASMGFGSEEGYEGPSESEGFSAEDSTEKLSGGNAKSAASAGDEF